MKQLLFFFLLPLSIWGQEWTKEEWDKANTCSKIEDLNDVEKEAVLYINLARMYPAKFAAIELADYWGPDKYEGYLKDSKFKQSLLDELEEREAISPFVFDEELQEFAACFAAEQGANGHMGHKRKNCPKDNFAECCAYDMETGKDIALQLLIDHNVSDLGHRINCLNPTLTKIGISFGTHIKANFCAVLDMK